MVYTNKIWSVFDVCRSFREMIWEAIATVCNKNWSITTKLLCIRTYIKRKSWPTIPYYTDPPITLLVFSERSNVITKFIGIKEKQSMPGWCNAAQYELLLSPFLIIFLQQHSLKCLNHHSLQTNAISVLLKMPHHAIYPFIVI